MQNKTALIVDDSRTACQMLRLMLEREEFQVDVLRNPEEAVGYLRDHRPGVIFMDHLMPGMEGFQAVKEIKNNSLAAQIPIVMYTAKSGDLYVGQAQALGAVDILPKPPTRDLLRAVFRRIDEREVAANDPGELVPFAPESAAVEFALTAVRTATGESIELARGQERNNAPPPAAAGAYRDEAGESLEEDAVGPGWPLAAALILGAAAAGVFGGLQLGSPRVVESDGQPYLETLSWALSQTLEYPYGEAPFGGQRVELLRGLVERLQSDGFRGEIRLEGHAGQFCLVASPGGWQVASPDTGIDRCDVKGFFSKQDARLASARQTPEFRALLESPAIAASGIRIVVEGQGDEMRAASYPTPEQVASAGEWNAVAASNNRITLKLVPEA
jgi:CheY-like chemotaxis protein